MNLGDWAAFLVAAGTFSFAAASMLRSRTQHEKAQKVVAPSLRQEIDRGVAQVEFEIDTGTGPQAWRNGALVLLGALLFSWEAGRLNGHAAPWDAVLIVLAVFFVAAVVGLVWARHYRAVRLPRKRALEALRAKLDESVATTQQ